MALIVEDGTGLADADALISRDYFETYCEGRGYDLSGYEGDTEVDPAIRRASDLFCGMAWKGAKLNGRDQSMPIDGVSGATRPAGQHQLRFADGKPPLGTLPPGHYELVVEAAREVGGREAQRIPFDWPATRPVHLSAKGSEELGQIDLDLNP